jgi:hypothetical protein
MLYSRRAGFHPRDRTLRVWAPADWDLRLGDAVGGWNHVAGRRLFEVERDQTRAEITLADTNDGEYTVMLGADGAFTRTEPYVRCEVHTTYVRGNKYDVIVAAHELGHCLGFRHRPVGIMGAGDFAVRADRRMLRRAGYA